MADVETPDERPHCEKLVTDDMTKQCGSERGLKRIKYANRPQGDRTFCRDHFPKQWTDPDATEAEPIKTAKANK